MWRRGSNLDLDMFAYMILIMQNTPSWQSANMPFLCHGTHVWHIASATISQTVVRQCNCWRYLMMFDGHLSTAGKCLQRSAHRTDMALKNDVPPFFWYQKWRKIKPCSLRAPRSCALAAQDSQVRTRPKDPQVHPRQRQKRLTQILLESISAESRGINVPTIWFWLI